MILYIIIGILIILTSILLYIKLKYKFWALQPVYHYYDLHYWFLKNGIIRKGLPVRNKYCNFKDIESIEYSDVTETKMLEFKKFICKYFLRNKENEYLPAIENITPYFIGHNNKCFFTFYNSTEYVNNTTINNQEIIKTNKILGAITARPLHVNFYNRKKIDSIDLYYIDYLCVDKEYRKKGIAPELIQTHEYLQSHSTDIQVSLFKKEGDLTGIMPLCLYKYYLYSMIKWKKPSNIKGNQKILNINSQNLHFLMDFIKLQIEANKFNVYIYSELGNMIELIKTQNIFVYILLIDNIVESAYFFRKSCTLIKKNEEILICYASLYNHKIGSLLFIHAFKLSLYQLLKQYKENKKSSLTQFVYLCMEDISENNIIINDLSIKTYPMLTINSAYFFYNYLYRPISSQKILILN